MCSMANGIPLFEGSIQCLFLAGEGTLTNFGILEKEDSPLATGHPCET